MDASVVFYFAAHLLSHLIPHSTHV